MAFIFSVKKCIEPNLPFLTVMPKMTIRPLTKMADRIIKSKT